MGLHDGRGLQRRSGNAVYLREQLLLLKVRARDVDGREVRVLYLDALLHSYVDVDDPYYLRCSCKKVFADLATYLGQTDPAMCVQFIGGGGYTMPRFLEVMFPRSNLEIKQIDPAVTKIATDYLGLGARTQIVTYNEDARTKLQQLDEGKYEMVMGDAFNDVSVPYHLTTREFNEHVRDRLSDSGVHAVNIARCTRAVPSLLRRYYAVDIRLRLRFVGRYAMDLGRPLHFCGRCFGSANIVSQD